MDTLIVFLTILAAVVVLDRLVGAAYKLRTWGWDVKLAWQYGLDDIVLEDRLWVAVLWLIAWMVAL